jgi:hypothetical protein
VQFRSNDVTIPPTSALLGNVPNSPFNRLGRLWIDPRNNQSPGLIPCRKGVARDASAGYREGNFVDFRRLILTSVERE